tara:strand:- start:48 stop:767 length:720 start_codon:yes stop_codon:yes gene_type:complete
MARSPNSKVLPFPATDQERLDAIKLHKQAVSNKQPIPYFIKEDGTTHYVDNKGRGRYAFNDLATKLRNEASRKATKKSLTPTLSDYKNVFGEEKGPTMYAEEQARLKKIYRVTPTATHDVDHIASQADKGPHHSRNLRAQNLARNRSEGQRGLTQQQRSDMLIGKTPKEHIAIQGPQMTPRQRQTYLKVGLATSGGGVKLKPMPTAPTKRQVLGKVLAGVATSTKTVDTGLDGLPIKIP